MRKDNKITTNLLDNKTSLTREKLYSLVIEVRETDLSDK